jgi:hypothetical protein
LSFDPDTHTYLLSDRITPSVTQILADCGVVDYGYRTSDMEYRLRRGQYVHDAIALWCQGELDEDSVDPAIMGYVDAARNYIIRERWEVLSVEQMVHASIGRIGAYAGRYDLLVQGGPLVDWKTGAVERWTRMQLAALAFAAGRQDVQRLGIRLNSDGTAEPTEFKHFKADLSKFACCLAVYYEKHPNKRRKRPIHGTDQAIMAEAL